MLDKVKSDPFDIAKQNLIEPYGLTEDNLFDLHNQLEVKGVDFADIYLQSIISESWNLEEGIVKGGAFSIDQVLVLVLSRETEHLLHFQIPSVERLWRSSQKHAIDFQTSTEKGNQFIWMEEKQSKSVQASSLYDYVTRSMQCLPRKRLSFCKN